MNFIIGKETTFSPLLKGKNITNYYRSLLIFYTFNFQISLLKVHVSRFVDILILLLNLLLLWQSYDVCENENENVAPIVNNKFEITDFNFNVSKS